MIDTNALRQKILDMAIRGKLVPQNPNDEPASVLLERIRAEKQQLIKEGKIKKDKNDSVIFKGDDNRYYEKVGSEVKDITDDLPFEIPDSWVWTRFSTLIQIISGVSYDKKDVATKGIRILRGGNINDLKVSLFSDDVFLPETYYDPDKQIQIDDVLIVASTGSKEVIGKAGYVIEPLVNTQIGAFLRIVRPILKWYAPYVKLIFATEYYREHIRHLSGGTNINNIKADYINALIISLPPYAEQIRIAERINSLFEQINIIEQSQTDTDTLYKEFIKRTLTLAIQGKLVPQDPNDEPANVLLERIRAEKKAKLGKKYVDSYIYKSDDNCYYEKVGTNDPVCLDNLTFDIPDSWCWTRLENTVIINPRNDLPNNLEVSFVEMKAISDGYKNQFSATTRLWRKVKSGFTHFQDGDVGFAKITPCFQNRKSVVFSGLQNGYGAGTTELHILRPIPGTVLPKYLLYFVKSPYLIEYGKQKFSGTAGQQRFGTNEVKMTLFPLPPLAEQERIVKQVEIVLDELKDEG